MNITFDHERLKPLRVPTLPQSCVRCVAAECSTPNRCDPRGDGAAVGGGCNVCPHCCTAGMSEQTACDKCTFDFCENTDRRCELDSGFDCERLT